MLTRRFLLHVLCTVLPFMAVAQSWQILEGAEKKSLLTKIQQANDGKGCHKLRYETYNWTTENAPLEILTGKQCITKTGTVINVHSTYLMYTNDSVAITVDSLARTLEIQHNLAGMSAQANGQLKFEALIERKATVSTRTVGSKKEVKIQSMESNGISHYILSVDSDFVLAVLEIHFEIQESPRYMQPADRNKPIMVISFREDRNRDLIDLTKQSYFLVEDNGKQVPSYHFTGYTLIDNRYTLTK